VAKPFGRKLDPQYLAATGKLRKTVMADYNWRPGNLTESLAFC
jgi:hypothetical protein